MGLVEQITLRVRRGEGPVAKGVRGIYKGLLRSNLPVPSFLLPVFRVLYGFPFAIKFWFRWIVNYLYREPAFRSRCTSVGRNLSIWWLPHVSGHAQIFIGNDVSMYGHLGVGSGRIFDTPKLVIGDRVDLGHNVFITVNREVIIEDDVNIASDVHILDSDGHPRDPELRAKNLPPPPEEIKPIRICRKAWIGQGSYILKGVTIGEGAIIGANSVVITDIPPFALALGSPARVLVKDVRNNTNSSRPQTSESAITT